MDWDKIDSVAGGMTTDEYYTEALFALGGKYSSYGLVVPSPAAGHLILLEILKSPFIKGGEIKDEDIDKAIFIMTMGEDAVGAVFEDHLFDLSMKDRVDEFISTVKNYNRAVFNLFLGTYFKYAMHGFDMIPSCNSEPKRMSFDAEWLISYVSTCTKITGYSADRIIWDMPVLFGGFCVVQNGKENGQKGIERPKNWKAIFNELRNQMDNG